MSLNANTQSALEQQAEQQLLLEHWLHPLLDNPAAKTLKAGLDELANMGIKLNIGMEFQPSGDQQRVRIYIHHSHHYKSESLHIYFEEKGRYEKANFNTSNNFSAKKSLSDSAAMERELGVFIAKISPNEPKLKDRYARIQQEVASKIAERLNAAAAAEAAEARAIQARRDAEAAIAEAEASKAKAEADKALYEKILAEREAKIRTSRSLSFEALQEDIAQRMLKIDQKITRLHDQLDAQHAFQKNWHQELLAKYPSLRRAPTNPDENSTAHWLANSLEQEGIIRLSAFEKFTSFFTRKRDEFIMAKAEQSPHAQIRLIELRQGLREWQNNNHQPDTENLMTQAITACQHDMVMLQKMDQLLMVTLSRHPQLGSSRISLYGDLSQEFSLLQAGLQQAIAHNHQHDRVAVSQAVAEIYPAAIPLPDDASNSAATTPQIRL